MAVPFLDTIDVTTPNEILTSYDGVGNRIGLYRSLNDPNGSVSAHPGSLCMVTATGTLYRKETGAGTPTGWVQMASTADTHFANTDLAATANRSHNFNGNALALLNLDSANLASTFGITMSGEHITARGNEVRVKNEVTTAPGVLKLFEATTSGGVESVGIDVPTDLNTSWTLTLPGTPPTELQMLMADANGNASFVTPQLADTYFRNAWPSLSALNDAATNLTAPFDVTPPRVGDYAILNNGVSAATWAYYDAGTPGFLELVPGQTPNVNLSITNRGSSTFDVATGIGTNATVPAATQSLSGGLTANDKGKLDNTAAYSALYGDGVTTVFTINHAISTRNLHVAIQENSGSRRMVYPTVELTTTGSLTIRHAVAPASSAYRVTVSKINQAA